jgi:hypothetical protein
MDRPQGSNADEWHLFLSENKDALPMVAVQIAEAIEARRTVDRLQLAKALLATGMVPAIILGPRRHSWAYERAHALIRWIEEREAATETQRRDVIEGLKKIYGVDTEGEVLKRALQMAIAAAKFVDQETGGPGSP